MSSELDQITENLGNIDLSTIETSFPLLATGIVSAQIQQCAFQRDVEKKGADAKPYLHVQYAITCPWKTVSHDLESRPLNPGDRGMTITENIYYGTYVDDRDGKTKQYGVDRIALLRECVYGKATPGTRFDPNEMVGQPITLKLKFDPAPKNKKTNEVYGPRTSVDGYVRKSN